MADIEPPVWRCKKRIGNLMGRLNKHAEGEIELTATQVAAIRLYLDKTLPSLASTTISGDPEGSPVKHSIDVRFVDAEPRAD